MLVTEFNKADNYFEQLIESVANTPDTLIYFRAYIESGKFNFKIHPKLQMGLEVTFDNSSPIFNVYYAYWNQVISRSDSLMKKPGNPQLVIVSLAPEGGLSKSNQQERRLTRSYSNFKQYRTGNSMASDNIRFYKKETGLYPDDSGFDRLSEKMDFISRSFGNDFRSCLSGTNKILIRRTISDAGKIKITEKKYSL